MSDKSLIEWTDATWQIVTGCDIESPGCKNCYAMKLAGTRLRHHPSRVGLTMPSAAGPVWTGEVRFNEQWLEQPLMWKRPRKIFVAAHGDLFHPGLSFETLDKIFAVMALAPQHQFQVLTKRTARMAEYFANPMREAFIGRQVSLLNLKRTGSPVSEWSGLPMPNVWLGTSVENQKYADLRWDPLAQLACRGWVTWVSYEPALGQVDWTCWGFIRWMVAGGESGTGARPAHPDWFRAARDFCASADVPFLFKQNGNWVSVSEVEGPGVHHTFPDGATVRHLHKKLAGRTLDGIEHNGYPK